MKKTIEYYGTLGWLISNGFDLKDAYEMTEFIINGIEMEKV